MTLVDSALHEAAHAVVARALGLDVTRVFISRSGGRSHTEIQARHRVNPVIHGLVAAAPAVCSASLGLGAENLSPEDELALDTSGTDIEVLQDVAAVIVVVPEVREAMGRVINALLAVQDLPRAAVIGLVGPDVRTAVIRALRVKKIQIEAELAA